MNPNFIPIRTKLVVGLALVAFVFSGCASLGPTKEDPRTAAQRLLDKYLSPGFTGNLSIRESIPVYLTVTLEGANLRRDATGWKYDWFEYNRTGPFGTSAQVKLGKRP